MLEQTGHVGTYHATLFAGKPCSPARVVHCHHSMIELSGQDTECIDAKEGNTFDTFPAVIERRRRAVPGGNMGEDVGNLIQTI